MIAINSAAVEPALKKAYAYSRTAYETFAETNDEVKRVFEKQTAEVNKAAIAALEEAFKYAPGRLRDGRRQREVGDRRRAERLRQLHRDQQADLRHGREVGRAERRHRQGRRRQGQAHRTRRSK